MTSGPRGPQPDDAASIFDGAFRLVVVLAVALGVLMAVRLVADSLQVGPRAAVASPSASAAPSAVATVDVGHFLEDAPGPAPELALHGPDGEVRLSSLRGAPVLVFFGYTHCPDVCPATIGTVGLAIDAYGSGARALFVSVDPERDTPDWLVEFVRYMPKGFTAVTGTPAEVRSTADAWGVRYARVETDRPDAYLMSHTADVFLVDAAGLLRARFPFGTEAPVMTAVLEAVAGDPVAAATSPSPTPGPSAAVTPSPTVTAGPSPTPQVADLGPLLVSSSVWAGETPLIFTLEGAEPLPADIDAASVALTATVLDADGRPTGPAVVARPVRPPGIDLVSYVAVVEIPAPGPWIVELARGAARGTLPVTALDPGSTPRIGGPAPSLATGAATSPGEALTALTTDPLPEPRLYRTSTADALATGTPFVFVVDSYSFKVTPQCGQAVVLAKRLVDRWRAVPFIHHEPYRYRVVTTEPVLEGTLADPVLTDVADAWGVGSEPWGKASMPWIFIVDGNGIVRARYQGIIGSADVDVLLALLAEGD
jgi:protein SCO1/2